MSVRLPGNQNNFTRLVCAAAAAKGTPCVVLIMSGSAVDTEEIEDDPNVSALMVRLKEGHTICTRI
jgi:hypothetical protein